MSHMAKGSISQQSKGDKGDAVPVKEKETKDEGQRKTNGDKGKRKRERVIRQTTEMLKLDESSSQSDEDKR